MSPALTSSLHTSETSELPVRKRMAHTAALGESPATRTLRPKSCQLPYCRPLTQNADLAPVLRFFWDSNLHVEDDVFRPVSNCRGADSGICSDSSVLS